MVIDSHHHFWNYDPVEYDWIDESKQAIRRSFLPSDLKAEIDQAGVDGVVSVQARQIVEETDEDELEIDFESTDDEQETNEWMFNMY